ncbi:hypothetical protein RRG08_015275 [Elysia crispata]|uniref:Uncharacterized protein n=1 Tax=Elysia crispata TaxID=231223 RepID=A0AAE1AT02_9GAST|nr:hypothetical protein RRG08_015275 [Elysia crispata]
MKFTPPLFQEAVSVSESGSLKQRYEGSDFLAHLKGVSCYSTSADPLAGKPDRKCLRLRKSFNSSQFFPPKRANEMSPDMLTEGSSMKKIFSPSGKQFSRRATFLQGGFATLREGGFAPLKVCFANPPKGMSNPRAKRGD